MVFDSLNKMNTNDVKKSDAFGLILTIKYSMYTNYFVRHDTLLAAHCTILRKDTSKDSIIIGFSENHHQMQI